MLRRSIDLLKMWIDGFYVIDFQQNDQLYKLFEQFIDREVFIGMTLFFYSFLKL